VEPNYPPSEGEIKKTTDEQPNNNRKNDGQGFMKIARSFISDLFRQEENNNNPTSR
jgi:hypothetical protein